MRRIGVFKRSLFIIALLATSLQGIAQEINPKRSSVAFSIKNAGVMVDGEFKGITGSIEFNPDKLSDSHFSARVAVESISTGIEMRDNHLRSEDYFNAAKYPAMTFKSTAIVQSGNSYWVKGDLTIKDVTQSISFPFQAISSDGNWKLSGEFEIDRLNFHVGEKSWVMGDRVNVTLVVISEK